MLMLLAACSPRAIAPTPTITPQPTIVTLTFDDGDADNFPAAALLQQYGLHATFFIPSGLTGMNGYMTWEQLTQLQQAGNEIGGHTLDHTKVQGLEAAALRHEICDDRLNLAAHGFTPVSFAYPFGNYDPASTAMVKECGYLGARTIRDGPQLMPPGNPYLIKAVPYIVSDTDLPKLERYISGARSAGGGWVILTFHHVCESCDYFAIKPEVWSAFVPWLAHQQELGHLTVKTFAQALAGK